VGKVGAEVRHYHPGRQAVPDGFITASPSSELSYGDS